MNDDEKYEKFNNALEELRKAYAEHDAYLDKVADDCDPEIKLAVTRWAMKHIVEHAREGGTFRYLIYDRLGFDESAYSSLFSDGMTISNEFDLDLKERVAACLKDNDVEGAKRALGYCDEPNCFNEASCAYPTADNEYRYSCGDHYRQYRKKEDE